MRTHQRHGPARFLVPLVFAALLGVAACSAGEESADGVATLGAGAGRDDGDERDGSVGGGGGRGGGRPDAEFQDAMLDFAECMREQGIDFPDPQVQDGGGVVIAGPAGGGDGPSGDAEIAEMEAADEACRPILEEVEGAFEEPDPEQLQEMQDQALEFARCMREHGIDMPDPEFGEGGRITQSVGGPGGGAIDVDDEDFRAAQEACAAEGGPGGGPDAGEDG